MTHSYEYTRQYQHDKPKPGGILINPEDALPSMRDQIHTDPKVGTYALLKPRHGDSTQIRTRQFEYEFTKPIVAKKEPIKTGGVLIRPEDARADMRQSLHLDPRTNLTYAILKPATTVAPKRRFSYEFTLPSSKKAQIKTGGILIKPEDARPDMRHSIHIDPRTNSTYAILKPWSQREHGSSGEMKEGERFHNIEFFHKSQRPERKEKVKTGGILIKPEDARPDMRHSIHIDPRTHSTYAILKPWEQVQREHGSTGENKEGERLHEIEFLPRPERVQRRERVKTGGILIKPEDARPDMRHSLHVDPRTHSTYALLKPFEERRHSRVVDTRSSLDGLNDMNAQVDTIIHRTRNILSESYVGSVPSLGYLPDVGFA